MARPSFAGIVIIAAIWISLAASCCFGQVNLPSPSEWSPPQDAPAAPGDAFGITFPATPVAIAPNAPAISEWNRTVKPGESFTMTGARFTLRTGTDAGTDTTVWVWAQTPSGGALRQATIWKVAENVLLAALPDDIPFGMYMVWVENEAGASAPICLNRVQAEWVGPLGNTVQAGSKKRVFGRNISYNHDAGVSNAYIQPAGGGSFISCPTDSSNPYMVQFTVPAGTPNGNYKVFVHSGHGGDYGWSTGLGLVVQNDWVRGSDQVSLNPNGYDDTTAIQNAINQMSALPGGGTVRLAAGTFKTYGQIWVTSGVKLAGAGKSATTIELSAGSNAYYCLGVHGSHIAFDGLTLKATANGPKFGIIGGPAPTYNPMEADDIKYTNICLTSASGVILSYNTLGYSRVEASGCDFYRGIDAGTVDGWMHDCNCYGGPYGNVATQVGSTQAAMLPGSTSIFENNHIETQNWQDNYKGYAIWAPRVALYSYNTAHTYLANLTTKDVAIQDNSGEMFLFHGMGCNWFGNVVSAQGTNVTLRTDGTVNANVTYINNYSNSMQGGLSVPNSRITLTTDGCRLVIISGTGFGQARKIISHTSSSVTVDQPWRIAPDGTSVAEITPLYVDHVIYNNDLNGFPVGSQQSMSDSMAQDIDGGGWMINAEGNTSHRTQTAARITSNSGGPSFWNEIRDQKAYDVAGSGYVIAPWEANSVGQTLCGNACRSSQVFIAGSSSSGGARGTGEGTIFEGMTVSPRLGYSLSGAYPSGSWADGSVIYRNGSVTATDIGFQPPAPEPVYFPADSGGKQLLVGNSYTAGAQNYYFASGVSPHAFPLPTIRCARVSTQVGRGPQNTVVPITNPGSQSVSISATPSDPWITASIVGESTLVAESSSGNLLITISSNGLTAGRHWGSVTLAGGGQSAKIGVVADVAEPPGTIAGVVRDTRNNGIPNATVQVTGGLSAVTDSAGAYSITINAGTYSVGANKAGYTGGQQLLIAVNSDKIANQDFILQFSGQVSGTVKDTNGNYMPNVSISCMGGSAAATTDSSGHYCLPVPTPGSYDIFASKPGYASWTPVSGLEEGLVVDGTQLVTQDFVLRSIARLSDVKALPNNAYIAFDRSMVAIAASGTYTDGGIYINESDRSTGIRVTGAGTVNLWDNLVISGSLETEPTGERVIRAKSVTSHAGDPLVSLGFTNNALRGTAQFVRIWGKMIGKADTYITIDDGSNSPARVQIDGLVIPITTSISIGDYISVAGPAGMMDSRPCVMPRGESDIKVYRP